MESHDHDHGKANGATVGRLVFVGFALVAGYFLVTEHRAHLFAALPYLLLAACPLMHLFHHGRHVDGAGNGPGEGRPKPESDAANKKHH